MSPTAVNLNYQIGGLNNQGAQQTVTLATTNPVALPYQFGAPAVGPNPQGCDWIAVSPASGTIPSAGSAQSTVSYNCPGGLQPGMYSGSIPVSVGPGSPVPASVPVNLVVSSSPLLFLPVTALNFSYGLGANAPAVQVVTPQSTAVAASSTTGQMPLTASASTASGGDWLSVAPTVNFSTGTPISVAVNPVNLLPGIYTGTVTVAPASGAGAGNGAQTIQVTLTVASDAVIQASGAYGSYSGPIPPPSPVPLSSVSFAYQIGQAAPPLQGVFLSSSTGAQLNYSVTPAEVTCGSVTWLNLGGYIIGVTGQDPEVTVGVQNLESLPVGACTGTITVNAIDPATGNPALGSPLSIPVTLYVSDNPLLSVYAPYLGFALPVGGSLATYNIGVNSTKPSANIGFTVSETTSSGGNWLTVSSGGSNLVPVSANPGLLPAGTYNGTVTITATSSGVANSPTSIPVALKVASGALLFSASSLDFGYVSGGAIPAAQTVQVTSSGSPLNFTAVANPGTAGVNWLSVTPVTGTTPSSFSVSVNPSGLTAGTYIGTVFVTSPNASNSPFHFQVTLAVSASAISASPPPSAGLTFTLPQGGFNGGFGPYAQGPAQTITVSSAPVSLSFTASVATASGGNWLTVTPSSGTTTSTVQVSVNAASLPVGTYTGTVTITAPYVTGSPITYAITFIVEPDLIIFAPATLSFGYALNAPTPAAQAFEISAGYTNGVEPIGPEFFSATASATTNSGGKWLSVTQPASGNIITGTISASVNPAGLAAGLYTGAIVISSPDVLLPATVPVTLTVSAQATPAITAVANVASGLIGAVSPGEEVAIYGSNFGPATVVAATPTGGAYSTALSNTQVFFDGAAAPVIAVANGQVNVMAPYGISGKAATAIQVSFFGVTSAGIAYNVAAAVPGIYTLNQSGTGQGAILNQDLSVNGSSNPAAKGSVVAIYMTGEGITSPPGITGQLAPTDGSGLNAPLLTVTATIGGIPAQVLYAGSAPGLVYGVMQVNVRIPANAPSGNVFVVVTVGSSNTQGGVTVAVQ